MQQMIIFYFKFFYLMILRSVQQWIEQAKQGRKYIVFFEDKVIDITKFIFQHPGGKQILINYIYKDITDVIFKVFSHQKNTTIAKIHQLVIGYTKTKKITKAIKNSSLSPIKKQKKKVSFEDQKMQETKGTDEKSRVKAYSKTKQGKQNSNLKQSEAQNKDKRFKVSIKVLQTTNFDKVLQQDKFKDWDDQPFQVKKQPKMIQKRSRRSEKASSFQDLQEKKPAFKVRNIQVKHMKSLSKEQYFITK